MLKRVALLTPFALIVAAAACGSELPSSEDEQGAPQANTTDESLKGTPSGGDVIRPPTGSVPPAAAALNPAFDPPSVPFRPAAAWDPESDPRSAPFHPAPAAVDPVSDGAAVEASDAVGSTAGGLQVGAGIGVSGSWGGPSSTSARPTSTALRSSDPAWQSATSNRPSASASASRPIGTSGESWLTSATDCRRSAWQPSTGDTSCALFRSPCRTRRST